MQEGASNRGRRRKPTKERRSRGEVATKVRIRNSTLLWPVETTLSVAVMRARAVPYLRFTRLPPPQHSPSPHFSIHL